MRTLNFDPRQRLPSGVVASLDPLLADLHRDPAG